MVRLSSDTELYNIIKEALMKEKRVEFAYLYGSVSEDVEGKDIDIAVFADDDADPHELSADLKVALYRSTGLSPDLFDIRILNEVLSKGDLFSLIFLKNVLSKNRLIIDRDNEKRAEFIERYGMKFRECEGLINEVLS